MVKINRVQHHSFSLPESFICGVPAIVQVQREMESWRARWKRGIGASDVLHLRFLGVFGIRPKLYKARQSALQQKHKIFGLFNILRCTTSARFVNGAETTQLCHFQTTRSVVVETIAFPWNWN
jgi:hypothetical protein